MEELHLSKALGTGTAYHRASVSRSEKSEQKVSVRNVATMLGTDRWSNFGSSATHERDTNTYPYSHPAVDRTVDRT